METTINQPSAGPTNKITASAAATSAFTVTVSVVGLVLKNLAPTWYDPDVMISILTAGPVVAGFLAGYFVRDKPTVVVKQ